MTQNDPLISQKPAQQCFQCRGLAHSAQKSEAERGARRSYSLESYRRRAQLLAAMVISSRRGPEECAKVVVDGLCRCIVVELESCVDDGAVELEGCVDDRGASSVLVPQLVIFNARALLERVLGCGSVKARRGLLMLRGAVLSIRPSSTRQLVGLGLATESWTPPTTLVWRK